MRARDDSRIAYGAVPWEARLGSLVRPLGDRAALVNEAGEGAQVDVGIRHFGDHLQAGCQLVEAPIDQPVRQQGHGGAVAGREVLKLD